MANVTVSKNNYTIDSLYQWDLNQVLTIEGLSLAKTPEVHFAHDHMRMAIVRQATMDAAGIVQVEVPNYLLQSSSRINAYVCIVEGEVFNTVCKVVIPVIARAKPSDYEGEDDAEVYSLDALSVEVETLDAGGAATVEKVLNPNGTWTLRFSIPRGPEGRGIKSIEVSSGAWLVNYTDGTTDTIPVHHSVARISEVTLLAANWTGEDNPYAQRVDIEGVTERSQVDLTPSVEQLAVFYDKSLAFVTENEDGVVTVYAIGQKPEHDYTIQVTITEVSA